MMVRDGYFGFKDYFKSLCDTLEDDKDFYLLGSDFASYLEALASFLLFFSSNPHQKHVVLCENFNLETSIWKVQVQAAVDWAFVDKEKWTRMIILSTVGSGRFSSERTIQEYAKKTWRIQPPLVTRFNKNIRMLEREGAFHLFIFLKKL